MNNSTNHLTQGNEEMELPSTLKVLFYIVVSTVAFASIIGNAVEITLFLRTQNLRTSTNYYITSMAFSDVLCVVSFWTLYSMSKLSVFGDVLTSFVCKLGAYFGYLSLSLSVLSLMLISVDRFVAIVFPMKVSMISRRVRSIFILLSWVFSLVFLIPAWSHLLSEKVQHTVLRLHLCRAFGLLFPTAYRHHNLKHMYHKFVA